MLVDRDFASGKTTDANDREVYLKNNSNNHRVLIRWELENYLYDEEVLQAYCAKNGLVFDRDSYRKHVADLVNENVKDQTGLIKNICGIKANINREKFKIELSKCVTSEMSVYKELQDCIFY